jgi:GH24 family phage-related lysozyme (muramidase)
LQTDPIGTKDDFNLYAYVGNDPLNRLDANGECSTASDAAAGDKCQQPATMHVDSDGMFQIRRRENPSNDESKLNTVHDDGAGNATSGIGHKEKNKAIGDKITTGERESNFVADIGKAELTVKQLVGPLKISQNEFNALSDAAFNVGGKTLLTLSPSLRAAIASADYKEMSKNLKYTYVSTSDGRRMRKDNLVERSEARRLQFIGGNKYD